MAGLATLHLTGLLVMPTIAQFLHGPLFVHLLLEAAEGTFNGFAFMALHVCHSFFTPFGQVESGTSETLFICLTEQMKNKLFHIM